MAEWDPIGVSDIPEAADEYDGYICGIYELLDQGSSEGALYSHLRGIEIGQMGMIDGTGEPLMREGHRSGCRVITDRSAAVFHQDLLNAARACDPNP